MPVHGASYPQTASQIDRGTAYKAWSDVDNIKASDNARASSAINIEDISDYLTAVNFGFSVTDDEIIRGIKVEVECCGIKILVGQSYLTQEVCDETIQLILGGTLIGDNLARPLEEWAEDETVEAVREFGGADNLWGATLTPAIINDTGFGVAIAGQSLQPLDPASTCKVDSVRMTVYTSLYDLKRKTNKYMNNLNVGSQVFVGTPFEGHVR